MDWKAQAISFAGILALVGFARLLRVGRSEPLTREEVEAHAAHELLPAKVTATFLSTDGRAAVVASDDHRLCLIKQHGAHPASRLLGTGTTSHRDDDVLVIDPGDRMFGAVRLDLPPAERDTLQALL